MRPANRVWRGRRAAALIALGALALAAQAPTRGGTHRPLPVAKIVQVSFSLGQFPQGAEVPVDQSQCRIERDLNRLVCLQKDVHLWAEFVPPVAELRIAALAYPDIELAKGAELTLTALCLQAGLAAQFAIGAESPVPGGGELLMTPWAPWTGFPRLICGGIGAPGGCAHASALAGPIHGNVYTVTARFQVEQPGVAYYGSLGAAGARAGGWGRILVVP